MKAEYDFANGNRGAIVPNKGKTRISIFIDNAILDVFRTRAAAAGTGYQTMMNEALKRFLAQEDTSCIDCSDTSTAVFASHGEGWPSQTFTG